MICAVPVLPATSMPLSAAAVPVVLTQLVPGGGGLQLAAFAVHDVTASASTFAPGCPSSGGSNALVARQRVAPHDHLATERGLGFFDGRRHWGHETIVRSRHGRLERRSRVPYESRWAPYVRAHEPGQGQLP